MAALTAGDKAPDFTAPDQNGQSVSLTDFKGKTVILYFYPKDDTPGCTAQACDLRDNYEMLTAQGYEVIGVSVDDEKSHKKFERKYQLPFTLIADTDHSLVEKYGVWAEKSMYGKTYMGTARTTFIISPESVISHIISKVDTKAASQQVLSVLKA